MALQHFDAVLGFSLIMLLLSMVITVGVQLASTLLVLRATNLKAGLSTLIAQAIPELRDHKDAISKAILHHPTLRSWTAFGRAWRFGKANAISKDEFLRVLQDLSVNARISQDPTATAQQKAAADALKALDLSSTAIAALARLSGARLTPEMSDQIKALTQNLMQAFPAQGQAVSTALAQAYAKGTSAIAGVEAWFDTVMDRTSDWFTLEARVLTIVLAFLFAILGRIDSIDLFKQLETNESARNQLVQNVSRISDQTEQILKHSTHVATDTLIGLRAKHPEQVFLANVPGDLNTEGDGAAWLHNQGRDAEKLLDEYHEDYRATIQKAIEQQTGDLRTMKAELDKTQLMIFHDKWDWNEAPGILLSGIFLSLGAPFWFSALKQLANLRPAIAGKIEDTSGAVATASADGGAARAQAGSAS